MAGGPMDKSPEAFRTISEVAEDLDLPQHVLRFWETRFAAIRPLKRGGGRRYYRPDDIDLLKGIRHLLYGEGYTIKGVQRILKGEGVRFVQAVGRGEQSVAASVPEAAETPRIEETEYASFEDDEVMAMPGSRREQAATGRGPASPEPDWGRLQAALEELLECDRVLSTLCSPEPGINE